MAASTDDLVAEIAKLTELLAASLKQNALLQKKVDFLMRQKFGRKSEKLSRDQLELLLAGMNAEDQEPEDEPPSPPKPRGGKPRKRKPRLPEDLPTETITIDPDEVTQDPAGYVCIGEEVLEQLDVIPPQYKCVRTVRRKFKKKHVRNHAPIIAPAPKRPVDSGYASPSLLADIVVKKYADHLPLYRQHQILMSRHGIYLPRQTMSDWVGIVAERWLAGIYEEIRENLRESDYLQIDETPVRYLREGGGGCGQGYLWVYHRPGGEVLYEWHTGRGAVCLEKTLSGFTGDVQCDGYSAYMSYAKNHEGIELLGCWAHARRKFREAEEEAPRIAGWFLQQIGQLYDVEDRLRDANASAVLRDALRSSDSSFVLSRIGTALQACSGKHHPQSQMGKAIGYALRQWDKLQRFCEDGRLEIDNNLAENAVRPTAIGKKNWLFFGHAEAGQRSAIIYTILANCRLLQINPFDYLRDVLARLPYMTNHQARVMTPANWLAEQVRADEKAA